MQHQPVRSSFVRSIAYENGVLEVALASGRTFRYNGITPEVFAEMQQAESVGKFYNSRIKNSYPVHTDEDDQTDTEVEL